MNSSIGLDGGEEEKLGTIQDDPEDAIAICIAICYVDISILPRHIQSMHDGKQPTLATVASDTMTGEDSQCFYTNSTKHDSMKLTNVEIGEQ